MDSQSQSPRHSVFSSSQKWTIVFLTALAGCLSPLTATIYLPALPTLSDAFHTSQELINLTVTIYMVFQGLTPMIWGVISDRVGRRPIYLTCIFLLCASCIGLALVPTSDYWLLLVLRCVQAGGSASTIALGAGVIVDIALPHQRGSMLGVFVAGPMVGPCIGPILGGVLSGAFGWRAIFWFLCICSGVVGLVMYLVFPETLRALVGNGSIRPPRFNRPVLKLLSPPHQDGEGSKAVSSRFQNPFVLFAYPDVLCLLFYNSFFNAIFYCVSVTISTVFVKKYAYLTETEVGLCFLPMGIGTLLGSILNGKILDREYKKCEARYLTDQNKGSESNVQRVSRNWEDLDFPLEKARLRLTPFWVTLNVVSVVGYGWSLQSGTSIAVPLVLTFLAGFPTICIMNTHQNVMMDLFPKQGSSVTAANNLIRCTMGAAFVSVIDLIVNGLNPGWTFTLLGGLCILGYPLSWYVMVYGGKWRARRLARG